MEFKLIGGVIYKLTSPSGKVYIGQTWDFNTRLIQHRHLKKKSSHPKLWCAIKKYEFDNFTHEIIDEADTQDVLDEKEIFWISHYNSTVTGYNCKSGGSRGRHSEDTKRKISENNWLLKKGASPEYRKNMSIACSGEKNGFFGKTHSEEFKAKQKSANLNKKLSKETCLKMSSSHLGTKQSKETNDRKSVANAKNTYQVTTPENEIIIVKSLSRYCYEVGLNQKYLHAVALGKRNHHKGYKVIKLYDYKTDQFLL